MPDKVNESPATPDVRAAEHIVRLRGDSYSFGPNQQNVVGAHAVSCGRHALVIANESRWLMPKLRQTFRDLLESGTRIAGGRSFLGAGPGAPKEDVDRIGRLIRSFRPDCIVAVGGGSTIDAVKAANRSTAGDGSALPIVAVQTSASSASHLTDLAFVADSGSRRNQIITSGVPTRAVFDPHITTSLPMGVTLDGAFYAIFRAVWAGLTEKGEPHNLTDTSDAPMPSMPALAVELILENLPRVAVDPADEEARYGLALATDLAGLATTGARNRTPGALGAALAALGCLPGHMRLSAIAAPYLLAASAGPGADDDEYIRSIGGLYTSAGYIDRDLDTLSGRELGKWVAKGMIRFMLKSGYPTVLPQIPGSPWQRITRDVGRL